MNDILAWLWTLWSYGILFALFLGAEIWLAAQIEPKEGWQYPGRFVQPLLLVGMVALAAVASYLVNQRPYGDDCPATYDRQGIHRDC